MSQLNTRRIVLLVGVLAFACTNLVAQKRSVWDGVYTTAEAGRGADAYRGSCAGCHAADLSGDGNAPSLEGESFQFQWSNMTVGDLYKRIRTAMPPDRPDSLSPDAYRDIVAFLLQFNKIPAGQVELDPAPESLQQIVITAAP